MNAENLRDVLLDTKVSIEDKLLFILHTFYGKPLPGTEIKRIATQVGVTEASSWRTTKHLTSVPQYAIRSKDGWLLTTHGRDYILSSNLINPKPVLSNVRQHLTSITDAATISFMEEAISCFEHKLFRAAIVLSWVGAVSVLYNYVIQHRLTDFNAEATRRSPKWKTATTADDLARMKESDFLDILDHLSILGRSVKKELLNCLDLRNGCGHPNSLKVGEHKVAAHLETLIDNVFTKYT